MEEKREKELLEKGEAWKEADEAEGVIPVYNGGKIVGFVEADEVEWSHDATWGGAWIGSERHLGTVLYEGEEVPVFTDGSEKYAVQE